MGTVSVAVWIPMIAIESVDGLYLCAAPSPGRPTKGE